MTFIWFSSEPNRTISSPPGRQVEEVCPGNKLCLHHTTEVQFLKTSCQNFLSSGLRYQHLSPPSPDTDYIPIRVELREKATRKLLEVRQEEAVRRVWCVPGWMAMARLLAPPTQLMDLNILPSLSPIPDTAPCVFPSQSHPCIMPISIHMLLDVMFILTWHLLLLLSVTGAVAAGSDPRRGAEPAPQARLCGLFRLGGGPVHPHPAQHRHAGRHRPRDAAGPAGV